MAPRRLLRCRQRGGASFVHGVWVNFRCSSIRNIIITVAVWAGAGRCFFGFPRAMDNHDHSSSSSRSRLNRGEAVRVWIATARSSGVKRSAPAPRSQSGRCSSYCDYDYYYNYYFYYYHYSTTPLLLYYYYYNHYYTTSLLPLLPLPLTLHSNGALLRSEQINSSANVAVRPMLKEPLLGLLLLLLLLLPLHHYTTTTTTTTTTTNTTTLLRHYYYYYLYHCFCLQLLLEYQSWLGLRPRRRNLLHGIAGFRRQAALALAEGYRSCKAQSSSAERQRRWV